MDNEQENLVIMKDKQAVTTSLRVAESFEKSHRHVLEAIRNLTAENSAVKNMFVESTYVNSRGQEHPMYYMNRDGFTLLAMGFTGDKALQFKLKYISAFNKMEAEIQVLKEIPTTPEGQLRLTMVVTNRLVKRMDNAEKEIDQIKNKAEIDSEQRYQFSQARKRRVFEVIGGSTSNYYVETRARKVFAALTHDIKAQFELDRFDRLRKEDFDDAIKYVKSWYPSFPLKHEIDELNAQTSFDL